MNLLESVFIMAKNFLFNFSVGILMIDNYIAISFDEIEISKADNHYFIYVWLKNRVVVTLIPNISDDIDIRVISDTEDEKLNNIEQIKLLKSIKDYVK